MTSASSGRLANGICIKGESIDVDGNGTADALTDGLLIIHYLFGLRGASLIRDAIGPGAQRTTAAQIETFLQAILP